MAKRTGEDIWEGRLRTRPDGSSPVAMRVPETMKCWNMGLPNLFYIPDLSPHPSRLPITGPGVKPHGIAWMEVGGSEKAMSDWLGIPATSLPLRFNGKAPGLYAVAVKTERGEAVIRLRSINEK